MNSTASNRRLASVDALRTAAFLLVVLCHFGTMIGPGFPPGPARAICDALAGFGWAGTNTFFLLSGWLLWRSLASGSSWSAAVRRRMVRIYPGFLAILSLYVVLSLLLPQLGKLPTDPLRAIFSVIANALLLPGLLPITPMVTVAWSLSYVVFGYCMIGAIHRFAARRWALGLAVAMLLGLSSWTNFPHSRLVFFPLGALLAELPKLPTLPKFDFPQSRWCREAGCLSYSVFLSHGLALHALQLAGPASSNLLDLGALLLAALCLVIVTAIAFETLVLAPLQALVEARSRRVAVASKFQRLQAGASAT